MIERFPEGFLDRLESIVGSDHFDDVVNSFRAPKFTVFRVNTLLGNAQDVLESLQTAEIAYSTIDWMQNAFCVHPKHRSELLQTDAFLNGKIYVQNASSMLPVLELDPKRGENVLDLTAAPGSKTSQIAALMDNEGYLAAVESVRGRYYKLKANLQRLGVTCVRPFHKDGSSVWRHRPEYFDKVLLDSPCSSEGRFRLEDPETMSYWSERKISEMNRKQIKLLQSAVRSVKVGGTVVYSTCSFAPEENEGMVTRILKRCDSFVAAAPLSIPCPNYSAPLPEWRGKKFTADHARRILPNDTMDGFFVAKFVKTAPNPSGTGRSGGSSNR